MVELDLVERHSHRVFDRVLGGLYDRVAAQDRLFSLFSVLSPAIAAQSLSAMLAGTDFSQHRHFIDAAEQYRRDLVNRMNADGMAHAAHGAERHTNDIGLWAQIPEFGYRHPRLGQTGLTITPSLMLLPLWLGLAFLTLSLVARRLKP